MAAAFLLVTGSENPRAEEGDPLLAAIAELTPPIAKEAMAQIPNTGRKLLALRSYLRARKRIAKRWSWTKAEIAAYQGTPEQLALFAEIEAVKAHFAENNPGYEIYVNNKVRSLDVQIERWNANKSVGRAAEEIHTAVLEKFGLKAGEDAEEAAESKTSKADPKKKVGLKKLSLILRGFRLSKRAYLAAPGLTAHGQARAIDFQVMKDGAIYAGANSRQIETIWRAEGWDKKLKASITAAGPSFKGPLKRPDEPWHYDYTPPKNGFPPARE